MKKKPPRLALEACGHVSAGELPEVWRKEKETSRCGRNVFASAEEYMYRAPASV